MSLKRYLFLLIGLFLLLMAAIQLGFIHYIQQQMSAEIESRSRALSQQALNVLVKKNEPHFIEPANSETPPDIYVQIQNTPRKTIALGNGYEFVTGEQTQTITISQPPKQTQVMRNDLQDSLQKMSISRLQNNYDFSVSLVTDKTLQQQIVQFDQQNSVITRYVNWLILFTSGFAVLGLIMAYYLARLISRPLGNLASGFAQLEAGELGKQLSVSGIQEVRDTLQRFNQMSVRLAQLNHIEKRFLQQQQMAELGEVARGLAHTLRNPINTIGLAIEQISQVEITEQQRLDLARQARQKIIHVDNTIKSLLNLTAAGICRDQQVPLTAVIDDIIMELSMSSDVRITLLPCEPVNILGAESEIRAMLHTLIVNAVEASPKNEQVTIKIVTQNGQINIEVTDLGAGLSPQIAEQLFKPHVTSKAEGAGMGLYIAKRISQSHYQGDVSVKNLSPKGCIATLSLSLQRETRTHE